LAGRDCPRHIHLAVPNFFQLDDSVKAQSIRLTPAEIVSTAREEGVHLVGLSILSGSHVPLVKDVVARMKEAGVDVPVIVGGIIPPDDADTLKAAGVAAKDFELNRIMADIVRIVDTSASET